MINFKSQLDSVMGRQFFNRVVSLPAFSINLRYDLVYEGGEGIRSDTIFPGFKNNK